MLDWINPTKIFPVTLITLDAGAALIYALHADWRLAVYWLSAAVLTICVTI